MHPNIATLYQKKYFLTESKTFCMLPWVHLHANPIGKATSCCISPTEIGSSVNTDIKTLINVNDMKKLRLDMINDVPNSACNACYIHEKNNVPSARNDFNKRFGHHFNEVIKNTDQTGYLSNFRMVYFDFRFNNICNFKCRTCGSEYSSQWEQEDLKRNLVFARIYPKNNSKDRLDELISHIPFMEEAYFAGGEPLITDEHYILLEEMLKQGRTDIKLSYNSNISNLKFKGRDILNLWSKFTNPVTMSASIDHFGERAEYIRHGTNWGTVESNLKLLKKSYNIVLGINSVLSVFNFVSFDEFYNYLFKQDILTPTDKTYQIYPSLSPEFLTSQVLPTHLKEIGNVRMHHLANTMKGNNFTPMQIREVEQAINWTNNNGTWETWKDLFRQEVQELDKIRGESFEKVFPELKSMLD